MFTGRDLDPGYDADNCVRIQLNGDSATATSDSVQISGTTISITEEAVYVVSGALDDGMIVVVAPSELGEDPAGAGRREHSQRNLRPRCMWPKRTRSFSRWRTARKTRCPTAERSPPSTAATSTTARSFPGRI